MKRLITFVIIAIITSVAICPQRYNNGQITTKTITGIVTDKEGIPVVGATVTATNGAEATETDANGSYSIEVPVWLKFLTASYPGLGAQIVKIKDKKVINFKLGKKLSQLKQ